MQNNLLASVNERFIEQIDLLRKNRLVSSYTDFAKKIGKSAQTILNIKANKQSVTLEILIISHKIFDIDINYVLLSENKGSSHTSKAVPGVNEPPAFYGKKQTLPGPDDCQAEINYLKRIVYLQNTLLKQAGFEDKTG